MFLRRSGADLLQHSTPGVKDHFASNPPLSPIGPLTLASCPQFAKDPALATRPARKKLHPPSLTGRICQLVCVVIAGFALSGCASPLGRLQSSSVGLSKNNQIAALNATTTANRATDGLVRFQSPADDRGTVRSTTPFDAAVPPPVPLPASAIEPSTSETGENPVPISLGSAQIAAAPPVTMNRVSSTPAGAPVSPGTGTMNSILRNRLDGASGGDESAGFTYPDIDADPGQLYREQFGVEGDYDPFLFPAIVNLIFEDRWLLAEKDPAKALQNQLRERLKIDIRDPDPDTANFPNGAYTLPKGRVYIETSPIGFYGASISGQQPRTYQWEYLIRMGLTDNLEFRIFSNGITAQAAQGNQPEIVGYSPLAFDFKVNFWEENTRYHVPAMGVEIYLQTELLGSSAFNSGTQPSINLLFDQSLPFEIGFEYNFGYTGAQNSLGEIAYQFSYQWSFQREVVKDFDVFIHGFYNAAALPRLGQFQTGTRAEIPKVNVMGFGGIWTVSDRLSVFGSYNFGLSSDAPTTIALMGLAVAL